jgi:hypothetical protein
MYEYYVSLTRQHSNGFYSLESHYLTDKEIEDLSNDPNITFKVDYNDFRQVENLSGPCNTGKENSLRRR